jgi:hypothetical protein
MDTLQTSTNPQAPMTSPPRHRHPRRATMGDDWQIGFSPRRPAPAPEPVRPAAASLDLGGWLSRLLGLEAETPEGTGARQPLAPAHQGR